MIGAGPIRPNRKGYFDVKVRYSNSTGKLLKLRQYIESLGLFSNFSIWRWYLHNSARKLIMVSVVIISDIRLYRESIAEILDRRESIQVLGTANNVDLAITEITKIEPEVALLDMTMAGSCQFVKTLAISCPDTKIIVLSVANDDDSILSCAKLGIAGYISRDASLEHLINAVNGVVNGEFYCPRTIAESLFNQINTIHKSEDVSKHDGVSDITGSKNPLLTHREKEIASLLSCGKSNKEIARDLTIEVSTVKNHVHNILVKMGVNNRTQAVTLLQHYIQTD